MSIQDELEASKGREMHVPEVPSIDILNQQIDDEDGMYRIRYGSRVGYLSMPADVFDEDTMCRPYLLIPKLPKSPPQDWTKMHIRRNAHDGSLQITYTNDPLPAIRSTWHQQYVDVLALKETRYYRSRIREVIYQGKPAIAKIAAFDWQIPSIENETFAYSIMETYLAANPECRRISPRFLGHLTENGRVMGMLLEKLEGEHASIQELDPCKDTLWILHKMDMIHGDPNRYNFIVEKESGEVKLVDFEHVEDYDEAKAALELESLAKELREETGRGRATAIES